MLFASFSESKALLATSPTGSKLPPVNLCR